MSCFMTRHHTSSNVFSLPPQRTADSGDVMAIHSIISQLELGLPVLPEHSSIW